MPRYLAVCAFSLTAAACFNRATPLDADSTMDAQPSVVEADGVAQARVTVRLRSPIPDARTQCVVQTTMGGVTIKQLGSADGGLTFDATATSASEGTAVLSAHLIRGTETVQLKGQAAVTFVHGSQGVLTSPSAAHSSLTASPNVLVADGAATSTLTLILRNGNGDALAGHALTWSSASTHTTLTQTSASTDANGRGFALARSTTSELDTITVSADGVALSADVLFTAGAPSAAQSQLTLVPSTVIADGTGVSNITVMVADAANNPIPNLPVAITVSGSGALVASPSGATDGGGAYRTVVSSTRAEAKTVQATAGALALSGVVTFTAGAASASASTLTASPNVVAADNVDFSTLTLTIVDAFGNPIGGQAATFTCGGVACILSSTSGTTDVNGHLTTTLTSNKAEIKTVSASAGGLVENVNVTFVAGQPDPSASTLVASPNVVAADGLSATNVTFYGVDFYGNPVVNQNVTITASGTLNNFTPPSGKTDATGHWSTVLRSTKAETKTLSANVNATTVSTSVTFVASSPNDLQTTLVANPTTLAADGYSTSALTLNAQDARGNAAANQNVTISVSAGTIVPTSGVTDANGILVAQLSSSTVQTSVATFVVGAVTKTASVTFTAATVSASNSSLVASPTTVTADGVATSTLTVTLKDGTNTVLAGQNVTFSSNGSANVFSLTSGTTDGAGQLSTTWRSTKAEVKTAAALSNGTQVNAAVTFVPGPPSAVHTQLTASPTTQVADGVQRIRLTATVRDANANVISGQAVTFAANNNTVVSPVSMVTDASGVANANATCTLAGSKLAVITAGGAGSVANITFVTGPPASATTFLTVNPNKTTVDTGATVTALVRDAQSNACIGQSVALSADGASTSFGAATGTTDANGRFVTTIGSTLPQNENVTATIGSLTPKALVTFNPGSAASMTLRGLYKAIARGEVDTGYVTVYDAFGNQATTYTGTVTFSSTDPSASLPGNYTFKSTDAGYHNFVDGVIWRTVGTQTVTVKDIANASLNANTSGIVVMPYTVEAIFSGADSDSICALMNNQNIKCWGYNPSAVLGYGDTTDRGVAIAQMGNGLPFVNMGAAFVVDSIASDGSAAGNPHACAMSSGGRVKCWGSNAQGQLGTGSTTNASTPPASNITLPGSGLAAAIATGSNFSCAIMTDQNIACWGANSSGQLGVGDINNRLSPTGPITMPGSRAVTQLSGGGGFVCALLDTGNVTCWGTNTNGGLGYGDTVERHAPGAPIPLAPRTAVYVSAGSNFACAILDNSGIDCWGGNAHGQLGVGDQNQHAAPTRIPAGTWSTARSPVQVAAGGTQSCALMDSGEVFCWGYNLRGQLGLGDTADRATPTNPVNLGSNRTATAIAVGNYFACALLDTRVVKCWGTNFVGSLGLGDTTQRGDTAASMGDNLPVTPLW